jgi:alkanesulfonate monooxygenase SsuD/methylene tetrahydromethanopterin reductase-like flavin-dependent oxidoreductase (luciferase family)
MVCPEDVPAMKLGFTLPIVGPAISSAAGLSALCRGLEDLGYDTLWVGDRLITPVDVDSSYLAKGPQMGRSLEPGTSVDSLAGRLTRFAESGIDEAFADTFAVFLSRDEMLDFAGQVIARTGR